MSPSRWAVTLSLLLCAGPARADDANYQSFLLGERAFGIGGAFCATSDDASGAFYNPAGLALVPGSSVSLSLSVYGVERYQVADGNRALLDGELYQRDFDETSLTSLPTTVGWVMKFGRRIDGGPKRGALGISIFLRDRSHLAIDSLLVGSPSRATFRLSVADRTSWLGPFFAYRLDPRLSLGGALFYSRRSVTRRRESGVETELPGCTTADCQSTELTIDDELVEYAADELLARLGIRYDFTSHLRAGLTLTTPSVPIRGDGRIAGYHTEVSIDPDTGEATASFDPRENRGLATRDAHPLELRLGLAYERRHHFLAAVDLTLHQPVSFDPVALPDPADPGTADVSHLHIATVDRRRVVNANLGGEYFFHRKWNLRAGFFTDLSSAPVVHEALANQLPQIDNYGVSAAIGYFSDANYELSFGVVYSFGRGTAAAWDPTAGATGLYVPTDASRDAVFFYLTGARTWAKRFAKKVARRITEPKKE